MKQLNYTKPVAVQQNKYRKKKTYHSIQDNKVIHVTTIHYYNLTKGHSLSSELIQCIFYQCELTDPY